MIQIRWSVNQADHMVVPRKDSWLSVEHFSERFVFSHSPIHYCLAADRGPFF